MRKKEHFNPFEVSEIDGRSAFGRAIIYKIREKKMTQESLRLQVGTTPSTMSKIINGKRIPSWCLMFKISEALDVSVIELLLQDIQPDILLNIVQKNIRNCTMAQKKMLAECVGAASNIKNQHEYR